MGGYKDGEVQIVQVDPFHPTFGLLFPFLLRRMLDFAHTHYDEIAPDEQVRELGMRVVAGDKHVLLLAFLAPDGKLLGHCVCFLMEAYGKRWLFVSQCKLDVPAGDTISRAIKIGEEFARNLGATMLLFETKRSDSAWARQFGFKVTRHIMIKYLDERKGEGEETRG